MATLQRQLAVQADRLDHEYSLLEPMLDASLEGPDADERVRILLGQAKRVRRESTLVVRAIARLRDDLQSEEDTRQ